MLKDGYLQRWRMTPEQEWFACNSHRASSNRVWGRVPTCLSLMDVAREEMSAKGQMYSACDCFLVEDCPLSHEHHQRWRKPWTQWSGKGARHRPVWIRVVIGLALVALELF